MILMLLACSGSGPAEDPAFLGGDYELATISMEDGCLDGALEALFMPQGRDTPQVFEYPIYVPGQNELPMTYEISLREPFVGVEITVDAGESTTLEGSTGVIDEVLLNEALYGDCVSSLQGEVQLVPETEESGTGTAQLTMADFRGSEERCPELDDDPCPVRLDLTLSRL